MEYIHRKIESSVLNMSALFPVVLVRGARKTGKSEMLRRLAKERNMKYISLSDRVFRVLAETDPELFFQMYAPPMVIDDIQFFPEFFDYIQKICSRTDQNGLFWLSALPKKDILHGLSQRLNEKMTVLEMYGLSKDEAAGDFSDDLYFSMECLEKRQQESAKKEKISDRICRGDLPALQGVRETEYQNYYNYYYDNFVIKDTAELFGLYQYDKFEAFLSACIANISKPLNRQGLAIAAGTSGPTSNKWVRILEDLGVFFLLPPHVNDQMYRLYKIPKLYFRNTGLAAFLCGINSPGDLKKSPFRDALFENYVVMEMIKSYSCGGLHPSITYYKDANAKEIDLFIEYGDKIHPFEIRREKNPDTGLLWKFDMMDRYTPKGGLGGIICTCETLTPINDRYSLIPYDIL